MNKLNLLNKTGILKLGDNLEINYGMYIPEQAKYINLSEKFNELIGENIHIRVVDMNTGKDLFNSTGLLINKKIVTEDYFVGDKNLSDILWYLTETKIRIVIDVEDNTEMTEKEDIK